MTELIPVEIIENKIYMVRGHKVMLDSDLAKLYDVETKRLNEAVKRNIERFPTDFMFQLTDDEWQTLRSQIATTKNVRGGRRYNPYVFSEHGILMLSNILNSQKAINISIQIVRIFTKLREMALTNKELSLQLKDLEQRLIDYVGETNIELMGHEQKINEIYQYIRYLSEKDKPTKIGFQTED